MVGAVTLIEVADPSETNVDPDDNAATRPSTDALARGEFG
jgi:hypothetical protein